MIDQAETARAKAEKLEKSTADYAKDGVDKLEKVGRDTARDVNAKIDSVDESVEKKAEEAKGGVSGWFGGKK